MRASIDVGTNTVRLLIAQVRDGKIEAHLRFRRITRLGGGFSAQGGLSPASVERTLDALKEIASILKEQDLSQVRAAATAVVRSAPDGRAFVEKVRLETGIDLEVIDGFREAQLSAGGVLTALSPIPRSCLIMDIGGGSTEFLLYGGEKVFFSRSYPLGVVSLCENQPSPGEQQHRIDEVVALFLRHLLEAGVDGAALDPTAPLVGTAGTVTTLAALKLGLTEYDPFKVNNLVLTAEELERMLHFLTPLSTREREALSGMEKGRGDLIVPGLRIVLSVLKATGRDRMVVSDAGLLEGLILDDPESSSHPE